MKSALKLLAGSTLMAVAVVVQSLLLLLLLPSRNVRIRACNYWGKVVGRGQMWISGCDVTITGEQHLDGTRPAIYISNHASIYDIFLAIFLSPVGTVGVAKRAVILYPFFGQMYVLSGHLLLDRRDHGRAMRSMKLLVSLVKKYALSIYIWPEGTRSRDGRLLPFKKGVVHLAIETGLPIVPVVVTGAHRGWEKNTIALRPVPIGVNVLPAISTEGWTVEQMDAQLKQIWEPIRDALPEDQRPLTS